MKELNGAEIFSAGVWNGIAFSADDLDAIVRDFYRLELGGRVPLKYGHNEDQPVTDGQPALGWVKRVYRAGEKLLADFVDLPSTVFESIQKGLYKFVSVELLQGVQHGEDVLPNVLTAVALLGADRPAVTNLRSLQELTMSRRTESFWRTGNRVSFTRASSPLPKGAKSDMDKAEVDKLIADAVSPLAAKVQTFTAENERLKADLKAEQERSARMRLDSHRAAIRQLFTVAIEAKRLVPASQTKFEKLVQFDKDDRVLDVKLEDVQEFIKDHAVEPPKDRAARVKGTASDAGRAVLLSNDGTTGGVVAVLVSAVAKDEKIDLSQPGGYEKANQLVFRAYPKLAKAYMADQHAKYEVAEHGDVPGIQEAAA